ncbi:MAG TPA: WD40 repeat domain-containing protein [Chthoniobacterales bacterium]
MTKANRSRLPSRWAGFCLSVAMQVSVARAEGPVPTLLPERPESILPTWTRHLDGALYSVAWTSDSHEMAVGGHGTIWRYRCPEFYEEAQLRADQGDVSGLAFSPGNVALVSGGRDGIIRFWVEGKISRQFTQGSWVLDLGWEPRSGTLAAIDESGLVKFWGRNGAQEASIQLNGNGLALDWSPLGGYLAVSTGQDGSSVAEIEAAQARIRWQRQDVPPDYHPPFGYGRDEVNGVAFSPDGQLIASTHQDGRLLIWRADNGQKVAAVQVHGQGVAGARRVAWSPDQRWICSCGEDGTVNLVPYPKLDGRLQLLAENRPVWSVRFSPDGKYLAAVGDGGEVWVWEVPPAEEASGGSPLAQSPRHHLTLSPSTTIPRIGHRQTPAPTARKHWWFW